MTDARTASLASRLWAYQAERFPLLRTAALVAVFSSASVAVSARLGGRAFPSPRVLAVAFVCVLVTFFLMRVADEHKDRVDDANWRPERPVPRGLVSLGELRMAALFAAGAALGASLRLGFEVTALLALAWGWLGLMTAEFFVPGWLRRHPFAYLFSHMLVMPFIDLFVTGCDWAAQGATMPSLLWLFLGLSLANGCVLEVGRKTWAPENERAGVETYSMLLGPSASSLLWTLFLFAALALLVRFGFASGFPSMAVPAVLLFGYCAHVGSVFSDEHDSALQKSIDDLSGYWVFTCYASAGFLPFVKVLFA